MLLINYWVLAKKIEVVKDEKYSQENIDNHSGQNYNVKNFCIATHGFFLFEWNDNC